ncbi:MAG: esterase [Betaproteobacteria bacterium]|nr:esterase [Betaproteobacteria bacterium]NCV61592.1 esterase [Betaproteobacteria bacterium]NDB11863.1 esterase [Betaproteobacteria bacterium]NDG57631.1 esterase [Betaproteobacteria bacterium]
MPDQLACNAAADRLIYLHGFRSSPASFKASLMRSCFTEAAMADRFCCPQLPMSPKASLALIDALYKPTARDVFVGSSLGGLYAHWLAERYGSRCVLLNPAIYPARKLASYIGPVKAYHDDKDLQWTENDVQELISIESVAITDPDRYLLVAATGDELIDWRDMTARYANTQQIIVEGSDHALSCFAQYLHQVLAFAGFHEALPT